MTVTAAWLTNRGDPAGGQSRVGTRLAPIGTWWPTGELTSRSGLVPGGSPCLVTGTGMTASVATGRAIIQGSTAAGAYDVAVTAAEPVVITNGDPTNPRRDIIGIRVYNNAIDASGLTLARVERLQGTAAAVPVDPTPPVGAVWLPLARIAVPANASAGSPINWGTAVTDLRVYTVVAGGILPVDASSAAGAYVGQVRIVGGRLTQWDGSAWTEFALPSTVAASTWGTWGAWTPTISASGTSPTGVVGTGRYARFGRLIVAQFALIWGSPSTPGVGTFQGMVIPVPARRLTGAELHLGQCQVNVGNESYAGVLMGTSGSGDIVSVARFRLQDVIVTASNWTSTSPSTAAPGTVCTGTLVYEATT